MMMLTTTLMMTKIVIDMEGTNVDDVDGEDVDDDANDDADDDENCC